MPSSLPLEYPITPNVRINSDDSRYVIKNELLILRAAK
jgi:hypothetical protein